MTTQEFDRYKGMIGRDFVFRGCDQYEGASFEHSCGWTVRLGPDAPVSLIAESIKSHNCEADNED